MDLPKIKLNIAREDRLAEYKGSDKIISSHEYQKRLDEEKGIIHSFMTKLPEVDKITKGFETGELVVISGFTGQGKTSFAQSLTENFAEQGIRSVWFSFEMPPRQFFSKFQNLPLFYLPQELKESSQSWIEDRIIESKIKYDTRIVMIDHLHFLVDLFRTQNASLEIGSIVRSLKKMAMRHHIIIFLIAHTSMPKKDKQPLLGDIRDSSFITQEADSVYTIQRIKNSKGIYGSEAWLSILKHRRCGIMGKNIKLIYNNKKFTEVDMSENE